MDYNTRSRKRIEEVLQLSYPIHRCVYRNDPDTLRSILQIPDQLAHINEPDNHGNSPIQLALQLDRRNCIMTLINFDCDCITRNWLNWNPLDEAICLGDIDIIEKIELSKWKQIGRQFVAPGGKLEEWNKVLPNVYYKLSLKFKSPVPVIAKFCPRDKVEVFKKGSNIRVNFGLCGVDRRAGIPRVLKGKMSIILTHQPNKEYPTIVLIDHKKKTYQEVFPHIPAWCVNNIVTQNIGISTLYKFFLDTSGVVFKKKKPNLFKKNNRNIVMESKDNKKGKLYKTDLYKGKGTNVIIRYRSGETTIGDRKSYIKTKILNIDESANRTKKRNSTASSSVLRKEISKINQIIIDSEDSDDTIKSTPKDHKNKNMNILNAINSLSDEKGKSKNGKSSLRNDLTSLPTPENSDYESDDSESDSDSDSDTEEMSSLHDTSELNMNNISFSSSHSGNNRQINDIIYSISNGKQLSKEEIGKINKIIIDGIDEDGNVLTQEELSLLNKHIAKYFNEMSNKDNEQSFGTLYKQNFDKAFDKAQNKVNEGNKNVVTTTATTSTTNTTTFSVVNKDGNIDNYEVCDGLEDTLDWETAFKEKYNEDPLATTNQPTSTATTPSTTSNMNDDEAECLAQIKAIDWKNTLLKEEDYFNPTQTEYMHMGRIMKIGEERKKIGRSLKLWLSKENTFPVNIDQFFPLIDFVFMVLFDNMNSGKNDGKDRAEYIYGRDKLAKQIGADKRFPIKTTIPIIATLKAQLKGLDCHVDPNQMPDELFKVPKDYMESDVYFRVL